MLHRILRVFSYQHCALSCSSLCARVLLKHGARPGRVTGVARVGQDWQQAKLKIRWNAVRGARAYQMRLVPKSQYKQLRRAKAVRTRTARGTYTRVLNRNRVYLVQVRAVKKHRKGKWWRTRALGSSSPHPSSLLRTRTRTRTRTRIRSCS